MAALSQELPILAVVKLGPRGGAWHWQAWLPNGAPLQAHLDRDQPAADPATLAAGQHWLVELTPFDFSHARLVQPAAESLPPEPLQ